jgi:uncharacterized protein YjeT (DUF2065 family)
MTFLEAFSMVLVIGGILIFFVSFTNVEMITGLWVAGDIQRDKQFTEAGQFRKRVYWILRIVGGLAFAAGLIIMSLNK